MKRAYFLGFVHVGLILEKGLNDALVRARQYIASGADGIMIHSRQKSEDEILAFCDSYNSFDVRVPLVVVPTSFSKVHEEKLSEYGVNIVIYANQLLRAAYPAMLSTATSILENGRSFEADSSLLPVKDILELIPGTN